MCDTHRRTLRVSSVLLGVCIGLPYGLLSHQGANTFMLAGFCIFLGLLGTWSRLYERAHPPRNPYPMRLFSDRVAFLQAIAPLAGAFGVSVLAGALG